MQTIRTLIVDDNAGFRRRLKEFLASEPDIQVIGEAADGQAAILKARELQPDLVLMDVRMPGTNGITATRQLKEEMPELKVIMLSILDVQEYKQAALAGGANGYVIKKSLIEELMPAIRTALAQAPAVWARPEEKLNITGGGGGRIHSQVE